jgi:hypothetical protein
MKPAFGAAGALWFVLASGPASAAPVSFVIAGQANIFGAGHTSPPGPVDGSGGQLPFQHAFASFPGQIVQFMNVSGLTGCRWETPFIGPEGGFCVGGPGTNVFSVAGISGVVHFGRQMFLAGVFTDGTEPVDPAPPRLDFTGADSFNDLFPILNQTFFIGDGLTGTGTGVPQNFHVPDRASRLHLGFIDSIGFGLGGGLPAGAYGDNTGQVTGQFEILGAIPEPASVLLVGIGLVALGAATRPLRGHKRQR